MPLKYPYADAALAPRVTQAREDQAVEEVAVLGTFPDEWVKRLVVLRAYIVTCIESQMSTDDIYAAKLASYRKDFNDALPQARAAQAAAEAAAGKQPRGGASFFTIDLQRG